MTPTRRRISVAALIALTAALGLAAASPAGAAPIPGPAGAAGPRIAVGWRHACAVTASGGIRCWGQNASGQLGNGTTSGSNNCGGAPCSAAPVTVSGIVNAVAVAVGDYHSCALLANGAVRCWGSNDYGQLGNGTNTDASVSVAVTGILSGAVGVSAGGATSCAVLGNGTAKCWGAQAGVGALGNNSLLDSTTPVLVSNLTSATAVSTGADHSCVVLAGGGARCWGGNGDGQLGNGTTVDSKTPVIVSAVADATQVSAGFLHSCARLANGTAKCWGFNAEGQIGNGTFGADVLTPTSVAGLTGITSIGAGGLGTCARLGTGAMRCWGSNGDGQLGNGTATGRSVTPVTIAGVAPVTVAAVGDSTNCAVLADGTAKCWGYNSDAQTGTFTGASGPPVTTPTAVSGFALGAKALSVSAGGTHTCAVLGTGAVKCWGANTYGQIGNGATGAAQTSPASVTGLSPGAVAVAAGASSTCAALADGSVKCWGNGANGRLGRGSTTSSAVPVAVTSVTQAVAVTVSAGGGHACALLAGGGIRCWGLGTSGQLGNATSITALSPVAVSGITTAASLSAGSAHTCALLASGAARCWGANSVGQLGTNSTTTATTPASVTNVSNATAIGAGGPNGHSCASISDGTVKCWGANNSGQTGKPLTTATVLAPAAVTNLTGAIAVAAGGSHSCAVVWLGAVRCFGLGTSGQLGNGATTTSASPVTVSFPSGVTPTGVTAGSAHTCSRVSSGAIRCWGANASGQLGTGSTAPSSTPVAVTGI